METMHLQALWLHSPVLFGAFGMFLIVYAFGYFILFGHWRWKDRAEAASCCISLAHGTPATLLAAYCILKSPWELAGRNTAFENGVMEFSIAYFIIDLAHYLFFFPDDFIFVAHHVATLFVMVSCRYYVGYGALTVMSLLFAAEITSACQNAWTLARVTRLESLTITAIYKVLCPSFYAFYTFIRGFVGPVLTYQLARFYISGKADDVIPRWLAFCWIFVVIIAIIGSIAWISSLWVELFRYHASMSNCGGYLQLGSSCGLYEWPLPHLDDFIFVAHHVATLFVMVSCRNYVGYRALTVMSLLFAAEITSACQNAWTLARVTRLESLRITAIYEVLCPFYAFYTFVRGFVAPVLTYQLARFYISGKADDVIPRWLPFCWISVVIIAIIGSIAWISSLWVKLFKYHASMRSDNFFVKTQ